MSLPIILVVDDDESIRKLLARMLRRVGLVHTVDCAAQGLLFMQNEPVDVVLSDQVMPDMLGDRLLAEVSCRWPDTERILMSGNCDPEVVNQGLRSGEIGCFLRKPIHTVELVREIQERAGRAYNRRVHPDNYPKAKTPRTRGG